MGSKCAVWSRHLPENAPPWLAVAIQAAEETLISPAQREQSRLAHEMLMLPNNLSDDPSSEKAARRNGRRAASNESVCRQAGGQIKGRRMWGTIFLIVLILLLLSAVPAWPYSRSWGYYPSGGLGVIVIVVIVLLLIGRM